MGAGKEKFVSSRIPSWPAWRVADTTLSKLREESWEELTCILLPLLHAPLMDRRRVAVLSPPRAA